MPMRIFASVYARNINIISIQTLIVEFWIVKTVYIQKLLLCLIVYHFLLPCQRW